MSIEVQRWFSLRCIVLKIFTINLEYDFAGFKNKTPRNQAIYLNVNIFGTMHRKLNHLWTSIDTGPLWKYAKCSSTILHNQEDTACVIWRCYGRFSRTITRDYAVFSPGVGKAFNKKHIVCSHMKSHSRKLSMQGNQCPKLKCLKINW